MTELPSPNLRRTSNWSAIWILPLLALLIGGWLGWKAYNEAGIEVRVRFDKGDDVLLAQIAVRPRGIIGRRIGRGAVLHDAQHPVVLQHGAQAGKFGVHRARTQQIVHLAEDQHAIDRTLHRFGRGLRTMDGDRGAGEVPGGVG